MITIALSRDAARTVCDVCIRAGSLETGGMLFAEHAATDVFRVVEVTSAPPGRFASFVRILTEGLARLEDFFRRHRRAYTRFNYLGEWHSHPSFALHPSATDDATMRDIVGDPRTGAFFVVLMIVKMEGGELRARAWAYFPHDSAEECRVEIEH
jgi:hypothetical protein